VRGADVVQDSSGTAHVVTRPVVAVCTCERSQRLPWCDGTHKAVQRAAQRTAQRTAKREAQREARRRPEDPA
jgi:CDGSH-type Zn-finger protein